VDYNAIKSALVAIPRDFRVKVTVREESRGVVGDVLEEGEGRTRDFYKE
jgi:phenylacetate 2-hydroxylase